MNELFEMEDLYPLIEEVIGSGGRFRLFPKGTSMLPLLRQGTDSVSLGKAEPIQKNDILLYRRRSGQFVLHRMLKETPDGYVMCGDNQVALEKGIRPDQILAKVWGIYRGEDYFELDCPAYRRYVRRRVASRLPRRITGGLKRRIFRVKG